MSPSAEFYFRAAQSHLEAAQYCYDGKQFGVAIAEAYHSVLASVKVRLPKRGKEAPNRHSRSLSHLYHEFVKSGDVDREVSSFIHKVQSYRDDWNYEASLPDNPKATTAEAIDVATRLMQMVAPNGPSRHQAEVPKG